MCKHIENTSKQGQRLARNAAEYAYRNRRWTFPDIWEAYNRPSADKIRAWRYCENLCSELNGLDLIVSSKNTFNFSVCFKFTDKETGALCYAYITKEYNRFCYA